MADRPKHTSSLAEKELDKAEKQFQAFDDNIKELTQDRMNLAPTHDVEPQTKLSHDDIAKSKDIYLKPLRTIGCRDKFNEDYRKEYNYDKEYVYFIAENKEMIGESMEFWTRPYAGMPAEEWRVPANKPVWAPRYVAEQIKRAKYHRLVMQETRSAGSDHAGQYYGSMAADSVIQRLDAYPVQSNKSVFMGSRNF